MYPLESTTYSNSDMQAEVRKLVQHWSASSTINVRIVAQESFGTEIGTNAFAFAILFFFFTKYEVVPYHGLKECGLSVSLLWPTCRNRWPENELLQGHQPKIETLS